MECAGEMNHTWYAERGEERRGRGGKGERKGEGEERGEVDVYTCIII